VIEAIRIVMATVQRLITSMQWEAAESRLSEYPDEAFSFAPPLNESALATACRMKANAGLIAALVKVNPDAATHKLITGKTPLHLWCSDLRRTSRGVGFADDVEVVRTILSARPEAATIPDADGWLPLHSACASGSAASVSIFRLLISAYPKSVLVRNKGGVTPLAMLWDRSALNDEDGRCILSVDAARFHERAAEMERIAAAKAFNRGGDVRPLGNSAALWSKILLMARAAYHGSLDDHERNSGTQVDDSIETDTNSASQENVRREGIFRPLHALAGIDCPASMVEFAIKVHARDPGALDEPDRYGNLPLHVAASRRTESSIDYGQSDFDRGRAIMMILKAYPHAVRVSNAAGRVPLNLAIESGATWVQGGIQQLFERAPEALEARDMQSRLYPFMLAASMGATEVSFLLLRHNPDLVASGCIVETEKCSLKYA